MWLTSVWMISLHQFNFLSAVMYNWSQQMKFWVIVNIRFDQFQKLAYFISFTLRNFKFTVNQPAGVFYLSFGLPCTVYFLILATPAQPRIVQVKWYVPRIRMTMLSTGSRDAVAVWNGLRYQRSQLGSRFSLYHRKIVRLRLITGKAESNRNKRIRPQ